MKRDQYDHWSEVKYLKDIVTNPLIEVGEYSYYSGYYDASNFEDGCVRYLWGDEKSRELFNPVGKYNWHLDKLIIGKDVCIGMQAMIMPGVKIGDGAVIAARSVVTKDVEAYTIVGGNPAKEIKKRFSDIEIEQLKEMQWYNWDREEIEENKHILSSGSIDELYAYYIARKKK